MGQENTFDKEIKDRRRSFIEIGVLRNKDSDSKDSDQHNFNN